MSWTVVPLPAVANIRTDGGRLRRAERGWAKGGGGRSWHESIKHVPTLNRPFAARGHMVQNPTYRRANEYDKY